MSKHSPCSPGTHSLVGEINVKLYCIVGSEERELEKQQERHQPALRDRSMSEGMLKEEIPLIGGLSYLLCPFLTS